MYGICSIKIRPDLTVLRINLPEYSEPWERAEDDCHALNLFTANGVEFHTYKIN